jgi:hypothetical protein
LPNSSPTITNNIIRGNGGNGIYCQEIGEGVEIEIKNNWIHSNGNNGIFIYNPDFYAPATIRNNTIVNNASYGINSYVADDANISNCIIWNNTAGPLHADYNTFSVRYSCTTDPNFMNPNDPNDYHLGPNSPCIDAGDPNGDYSGETDIDGEKRTIDGDSNGTEIVDIGADEYYWIVNFFDYAEFANAWRSSSGESNYNDIFDLEDNGFIDYADLAIFCEDWLSQAVWAKALTCGVGQGMIQTMGQSMSQTMTTDLAPTVGTAGESPYPSVSAEQQQIEKIEPLKIEQLIKWLEQVWLEEETQKLINEDLWLKFIESLKKEL